MQKLEHTKNRRDKCPKGRLQTAWDVNKETYVILPLSQRPEIQLSNRAFDQIQNYPDLFSSPFFNQEFNTRVISLVFRYL